MKNMSEMKQNSNSLLFCKTKREQISLIQRSISCCKKWPNLGVCVWI